MRKTNYNFDCELSIYLDVGTESHYPEKYTMTLNVGEIRDVTKITVLLIVLFLEKLLILYGYTFHLVLNEIDLFLKSIFRLKI